MSDYNFKGIKAQDIELLCLNRFNDSREFYEENKERLKNGITVPMRQIMLDLSPLMCDIDDMMLTDPVKSVSRIYRDTRGRRSKIKYRENMWMFFRRYKNEFPCAPFYYFEFYPDRYGYGLAFWTYRQSAFKEVHKLILSDGGRWENALASCKKAGFTYGSWDMYKKDMYPDAPADLKKYLLAKNMEFSFTSYDMKRLETPALIDDLYKAFDASREMYRFFLTAYDNMLQNGLIKPEEYNRR